MTYDNSQYPIQIGLQQLIGSTAPFNPANMVGRQHPSRSASAGPRDGRVMIPIAPVLLVFLFAQRSLVTGMLAGATKE